MLFRYSDPDASGRDYLDRALKAFELSKEHLWLFCQDKPAPLKESTAAGHAVQALDLLLEDLVGTSQVRLPLAAHKFSHMILNSSYPALMNTALIKF